MGAPKATAYVRTIERREGDVFYAKLKLPDGTQPQRRLGKVWKKRTRPPDGYLTKGMAQARLAAMLAGDDPLVNLTPTRVTFGQACDDWLDYIEHDRKRRPTTVRGYRNTVSCYLRPAFSDSTPIDDITTTEVDAYRERLVREAKLSPRTINLSLVLLHGIFKRAQRVHGLPSNPETGAERQPRRRSGDFPVLDPRGRRPARQQGGERAGRGAVHLRGVHRAAARGVCWGSAGATSTSPSGSSTFAARGFAVKARRRRQADRPGWRFG
jgi:hypothetical protein